MDHEPRTRQPGRPHYIPEWAALRGYQSQAELIRALGDPDKSTVSRWYNGATPNVESQMRLAALFDCSHDDLFRHPDERWVSQFFSGRERDEIERIKQSLELIFPRKAS